MQTTRQALDRWLLRLTSLELDNFVTLEDITKICNQFELLVTTNEDLSKRIAQLGTEGRTVEMQRTQLMGDMSDSYTLMIRDYARDSSTLAAKNIRKQLHALSQKDVPAMRAKKQLCVRLRRRRGVSFVIALLEAMVFFI